MDEESKKKADAALLAMEKTRKSVAEAVTTVTIGEHALALLREGACVTREVLRARLSKCLESTPSARGQGSPELDQERLVLLAALQVVEALPGPAPTAGQ